MERISPYALLQASRPKHTPTIVTAYDLYSAVQNGAYEPPASSPDSTAAAASSAPAAYSTGGVSAFPRTHYIKEIHARHNLVSRRTFR